jgi:hypothetical protein
MVTNVEMMDTPFLDWLPTGTKPVNVLYNYQAEQYADPVANSHVDGSPITGFLSAGDGRAKLIALVHYFTKTSSVTRLSQDVSNIAGISDELAHDIVKRTKELARDMEVAFLGDTDHIEDNGVVGYSTRGVGSWISSSAQTLYPVNSNFRTPAASISTTASASLTESTILDILESMGGVTKSTAPMTAFMGQKAKRAFNNIPLFTPTSVLVGGSPTGASGVTYEKNGRTIDRVFERYNTDFGPVDVPGVSWYNIFLTGTATARAYCTYILHQSMWELRWGPGADGASSSGKPNWMRNDYRGGAYEAFCEAIAMLVCKNPKGEGKYAPTA